MVGLKIKLKNKEIEEYKVDTDNGSKESDNSRFTKKTFKLKDEKEYSKGNKKKSNKYFYKVNNHHELFNIGRSFYSDYCSGVKSFAITSTGYQSSQQKTILGLASFFDHKEDIKIGIISDNLNDGAFKDIISISKDIKYNPWGENKEIKIKNFYNHFEFIDLNRLLALAIDRELDIDTKVFEHIIDLYDVVFWDVPELYKIQLDSEKYFPVIMKFESISIIVAKSLSKKSDVEDIKKFFLGYGINLKGLLLDKKTHKDEDLAETETEEIKTSWWKRIFNKKE